MTGHGNPPMNNASFDFAAARDVMVDGQLRPHRVSDPRILAAMRSLPREQFLPPHLAPLAYSDEDVSLGEGRFLIEPRVLARLIQLAHPSPGEKALVVGAGTGYGAAVLAASGPKVVALEEDLRLLAIARRALARYAPEVVLVEGPLIAGYPTHAPYDIILIEGAAAEIPAKLIEQLAPAPTGRLACVRSGAVPSASIGERGPMGLKLRAEFDCATPELPAFRRAPSFVF